MEIEAFFVTTFNGSANGGIANGHQIVSVDISFNKPSITFKFGTWLPNHANLDAVAFVVLKGM